MATYGYSKYGNVGGFNRVVELLYVDSVDSPRDSKGQLVLQQNPHERFFGKTLAWKTTKADKTGESISITPSNPRYLLYPGIDSIIAQAKQSAAARADGKLRKGSTALGVSLATWKQSSGMVKGRFGGAAKFFGRMVGLLEGVSSRRARLRKPNPSIGDVAEHLRGLGGHKAKTLADNLLEWEFGWKPLFEDLSGAVRACTTAYPPEFVRARHLTELPDREWVYENTPPWGAMRKYRFHDGQVRASVSYQVRVNNPNLWLANYLGLLNLPGIAWDLVPWSFVVNMFSNAGSLVNSLSNHVGLDISKYSTTTRVDLFSDHVKTEYYFRYTDVQMFVESHKKRVIGVVPDRTLVLKMPKADMELGLIASALVNQQLFKIRQRLGH